MFASQARVQLPDTVKKGETFSVKALVGHSMETGLRRDDQGKTIPRKIVNRFVCRYAGVVVFRADLHESVAANPYLEFYVQATSSGMIEFLWEEDGGAAVRLQKPILVS